MTKFGQIFLEDVGLEIYQSLYMAMVLFVVMDLRQVSWIPLGSHWEQWMARHHMDWRQVWEIEVMSYLTAYCRGHTIYITHWELWTEMLQETCLSNKYSGMIQMCML